jgi:hypothetical protein
VRNGSPAYHKPALRKRGCRSYGARSGVPLKRYTLSSSTERTSCFWMTPVYITTDHPDCNSASQRLHPFGMRIPHCKAVKPRLAKPGRIERNSPVNCT